MDHARCAALHNYLVHYAWVAEGRELAHLDGNDFFTPHNAAAEGLRSRLDPSLVAFLSAAVMPPANTPEPPPFFWYADGLSDPDDLFANQTADLFDEPPDSLVHLYGPNIGQGGSAGGGVLYDQRCHRAAVFMHMDDYDYALPAAAHAELWQPLETVLSNWIDLIHIGKIVAAPRDVPSRFGGQKIGPWEWRPYGEAQVDACVGAWDRLCSAIEARIGPADTTVVTDAPILELDPLLTPAALDAASVPAPSFARAFLTRARRPMFRCIAPGLLLPPTNSSEFAALQRFTRLPRGSHAVSPVCLFPAVQKQDHQADLSGTLSPFSNDFRTRSTDSPVPSRVPAGVYSESVERNAHDNTEEGFRLLLPYGLEGIELFGGEDADGARKSDRSSVERGAVAQLFQHGYKPFGGDYYRPQRLERLLDHWRTMVEDGIWSVGPHGVDGSIDTFRQADTAHWRNYVIPPTW
ncbi:hypothetical protein AB5N19_06960 [Seiridium cardinale]|uniref:Uncharacterized protein n=1 Tax=Seiridium cardinale TaxID=138064 RepID=A0ABR2XJS6_9PEZI